MTDLTLIRRWSIIICILLASCHGDTMIEHVKTTRDSQECRIFFFKGWGTYGHPVKPADPISYEEALSRPRFFRAWMCGLVDEQRFVLFEGVELEKSFLSGVDDASAGRFFEALDKNGEITVGSEIDVSQTIDTSKFSLSSRIDGGVQVQLVNQIVSHKFEYEYSETGALKKVILTNEDGDVNVLDY